MAQVVGVQLLDVPAQSRFVRGDVDGSTTVDIADPLALLWYLFLGGNALDCADAADADDSGSTEISDAISILQFLFGGGPPLPGPWRCGDDPTEDDISCDIPSCDGQ